MKFTSSNLAASCSQKNISNLIELQAEKSPDSIAIISENQRISYQELNQTVNQLAHYLRDLGAKPEVLVGLFFDRSPEMVIAILAVLKAGGAYVPLDPSYPIDRLSFVLEDTRAKVLITHSQLKSQLPTTSTTTICLDASWDIIAQQSTDNPENWATPENLAYVMYTSGSTSKPKGVAMPRASISYYVQSLNQILRVQADDTYLHTASFSFSSSIRQLMLPLTQGSKLVIASKAQTRDPLSLLELIQQHQITVFDTVPSVWQYALQQLKTLDPAAVRAIAPSSLKKTTFSGGLLPCSLYQEVRQLLGTEIEIFNIYGQTESIGLAAFSIPLTFDRSEGYVPVGRPLAHVQTVILNEKLQPVTPGEKGELCMVSPGLAREYLNLDDLTATRFIHYDLAPDRPAVRLYRTGDVAHLLSDETIELVGRTDYQIKIREMRVELEEIEAVLTQHPLVQQAIVSAVDDPNGSKQLVAFVVLTSETQPTGLTKILRQFLSTKLPDYMLPAMVLPLDRLPLNPNGKVDRKALPTLDQIQAASAVTCVPPRNNQERQLVEIWQKVLDIPQVGIRDNFFELGGNSLLAVSLLNKIETALKISLPVSIFVEAQTIEELSHYLNSSQPNAQKLLVTLRKGNPQKTPIFFVHALWGNALFYQKFINHLPSNHSCYGLQSSGSDGQHKPKTSIEEMASQYVEEILAVQPEGSYLLCGYSLGGIIAYELARQLIDREKDIALLCLIDSANPVKQKPSLASDQQIQSLKNSRVFHLDKLSKLNLTEQLQYIYYRLAWHFTTGKFGVFYKLYLQYLKRAPQNLRLLQIAAAHNQATKLYVPTALPVQITLFRGDQQALGLDLDRTLGWDDLATRGVVVHEFSGSHNSLMEEPTVQQLANKFQVCLTNAPSNSHLTGETEDFHG